MDSPSKDDNDLLKMIVDNCSSMWNGVRSVFAILTECALNPYLSMDRIRAMFTDALMANDDCNIVRYG